MEAPLPLDLAALEGVGGDGRALAGGGDVELEEVEEVVGGDVAEGAGVEDGEDAVFADGVVDGRMRWSSGRVPWEKNSSMSSSLPSATSSTRASWAALASASRLGGDGAAGAAAVAGGGVEKGFHGDEVD